MAFVWDQGHDGNLRGLCHCSHRDLAHHSHSEEDLEDETCQTSLASLEAEAAGHVASFLSHEAVHEVSGLSHEVSSLCLEAAPEVSCLYPVRDEGIPDEMRVS